MQPKQTMNTYDQKRIIRESYEKNDLNSVKDLIENYYMSPANRKMIVLSKHLEPLWHLLINDKSLSVRRTLAFYSSDIKILEKFSKSRDTITIRNLIGNANCPAEIANKFINHINPKILILALKKCNPESIPSNYLFHENLKIREAAISRLIQS